MKTLQLTTFLLILTSYASVAESPVFDAYAEPDRSYDPQSIVQIDEQTYLIIGTPLNLLEKQADAGNILLHRSKKTLFVVDTGAMPAYGLLLRQVAKKLAPFDEVVLINTHNHIDHNGNNEVVFDLGVNKVTHLMTSSARTALENQASYFARSAYSASLYHKRIPRLTNQTEATREHWQEELEIFSPVFPSTDTVTPLDSFPQQVLQLDGVVDMGWQLEDGFWVLPTRGHTAGSVVIFIEESGLLFLGDESNRAFHIFHDSGNLASLNGFKRYLALVLSGNATTVVDSHKFRIFSGKETATKFLLQFLENEAMDQAVFAEVLGSFGTQGATLDQLIEALLENEWWNKTYGPALKVWPAVLPMIVLRRLDQFGVVAQGSPPDTRFILE